MKRAKATKLLRLALFLVPFSLSLAACETLENLNPFEDRKTPLSGERRALFPDGVPGVERNAPPQQPTNSNIQIPTQQPGPDGNPDAQIQPPPSNNSDDPWAGRRR